MTSRSDEAMRCKFCNEVCNASNKTTMQPICQQCRKKEKRAADMPMSSIAREWLLRKWS